MSWRQPVVCSIIIITCTLLATGCWNRREPENLAYVLGLGFDLCEKTGLYEAYAQFSNPKGAGASNQSQNQSSKSQSTWTTQARGHTPYEAIFNMVPLVPRQLSGSHVAIVVISEKLAKQGIGPILDLFERERALRITTRPLVVKGEVGKLLTAELPLEEINSLGISRGASMCRVQRSIVPINYLVDVINHLAEPGKEAMIARLEVLNTKETLEEESEGDQDSVAAPVKLAGGAVFRNDRLVGEMNEREIRGWSWITNRVGRAVLVLELPEGAEGEYMTVVISQANSKLKTVVDGNHVSYRLRLYVDGRIEDQTGPLTLLNGPENIANINSRVATVIRNDIEMALAKAQSLKADVFGLGWLLYRTRYRDWLKVQGQWEETFSQVSVDLDIRADIRRSGSIHRTGNIR